ncbi:MAG: homoserine O-acetyltransferase [Planctomycetes bacterium]|nr:homoserine O-acetyltransferase [Planctomycetota bacterium]
MSGVRRNERAHGSTAEAPREAESASFDSDLDRHARELRHARRVTFDEPMRLMRGGSLPSVTVVYETYGKLNARRDNGVLICHAISGDSHVARHDANDDPGWWDLFVGPGKPVDTDRYFVVCPNILGGCRGSTGPNSVNPRTGRPYAADFPVITVEDIVDVQRKLVTHLGIDRLRAVIGGSLGGHMTLTWATRYPERLDGAVALATSAHLSSQSLAFDVVGRNAILCDPEYQGGQYYGNGAGPRVGLAIARMLGHITYLSPEVMTEKFAEERSEPREIRSRFETTFCVGSYLAHQGDKFGERFDANSYLTLSMAMDLFDLGSTPGKLAAALRASRCRWLVISYSSDWLFPPAQSREIVDALVAENKPVSYCNVESRNGHDAFLLPNDLGTYGELTRAFLANLGADARGAADPNSDQESPQAARHSPTSIFHARHRLDYERIAQLIPPAAAVLDLGCGSGGLLCRLADRQQGRLAGLELDERAVVSCVQRGLDVVQHDLNQGLAPFADRQFDFVVLSQTLQTVLDVERVIDEMLRVGKRCIVSFPNLGYEPHRVQLAEYGLAPRVDAARAFEWYNTPNVRFLTIADFEEFCRNKGLRIHERIALDTVAGQPVEHDPNRNANVAIIVLSQ